jgi:competence protein CoiA
LLTAKTKSGKKLCLGYEYKRETLLYLRSKEEFFCPVCGENVTLKLGEKRIYHFAHKKGGSCREFYENETDYHMNGKLQLYQWLRSQKIPVELEFYDKEIQQRPDIVFRFNGKKIALEYQCSVISEQLFTKRTDKYLQHGYTPLWILGGNHFKQYYDDTVSLTNFHYLFLRKMNTGQFYIPYYFSDKKTFHHLYSIFPFSTRKSLAQKLSHHLDQIKLSHLIEPKVINQLNIKAWKEKSERYQLHWSSYPSPQQKQFFKELYNQRMNLFLMPPEIGLPIPNMCLIQTPSFIWQAYLYLDVLQQKIPGDFISLKEIETCFQNRIKRGFIHTRSFPQVEHMPPFQAVIEYLFILIKYEVLKQVDTKHFQLNRSLRIPLNNREKEEMASHFYQQNDGIL